MLAHLEELKISVGDITKNHSLWLLFIQYGLQRITTVVVVMYCA